MEVLHFELRVIIIILLTNCKHFLANLKKLQSKNTVGNIKKIRGLPYPHKIENIVKDTVVHPELKRREFFVCALLRNEFY